MNIWDGPKCPKIYHSIFADLTLPPHCGGTQTSSDRLVSGFFIFWIVFRGRFRIICHLSTSVQWQRLKIFHLHCYSGVDFSYASFGCRLIDVWQRLVTLVFFPSCQRRFPKRMKKLAVTKYILILYRRAYPNVFCRNEFALYCVNNTLYFFLLRFSNQSITYIKRVLWDENLMCFITFLGYFNVSVFTPYLPKFLT